jgi:hypothetical protein
MSSKIQIVNYALTLLGAGRIMSIDDDVKQARDMKAIYDIAKDSLLGGYTWSFAKDRQSLVALTTAPAFGYARQFQLPAEALRLVMAGDYYVGMDLTDYRSAPTEEYTIEGRKILTDWPAPLNIIFVSRVEDTTYMPPPFVEAFAAKLAVMGAESLTQSSTKKADAQQILKEAISRAVQSNAIELPPRKLPDDEWLMSRL